MTIVIYLLVCILSIAGMWMIYQKAGHPGWASLIPIYNIFILLQIVKKPVWWIILFFIPLVNLIVLIMVSIELAKAFGKGGGYAAGLIFLPFIFYPLLGFGDARYVYKSKHIR